MSVRNARVEAALAALSTHLAAHPRAEIRDAAKFLYQSLYGGGHLVADRRAVEDRLKAEAASLSKTREKPLFEDLGGAYVRMDLSALRMLSVETAAAMFAVSAEPEPAEKTELAESLAALPGRGLFGDADSRRWAADYIKSGCPAVHHSAAYRAADEPAYRVIKSSFASFFPLFAALDRLLHGGAPVCVAIDGMCGSGKTTLAALVASVYDCTVFHADDFYLPKELRTPERYATPGGNIHWERLLAEVLRPLRAGLPVLYRPFDCRTMTLAETSERVTPKRLTVLEGSYALHPQLRGAYDCTVFLKTSPEAQAERLLRRDGPDALRMFREKWIPLENLYFDSLDVAAQADLVFTT